LFELGPISLASWGFVVLKAVEIAVVVVAAAAERAPFVLGRVLSTCLGTKKKILNS
jgi:hypothetical protein